MREFASEADLIANYREVRARMRALKPPAPPAPPAPPPIAMPAKIARGLILYAIVRIVEQNYGMSHGVLQSKTRTAKLVEPRQLAYYFLKEIGGATMPKIGSILSRDHTTVLHGIRRATERMQDDSEFAARAALIAKQIRERKRDEGTSDAIAS